MHWSLQSQEGSLPWQQVATGNHWYADMNNIASCKMTNSRFAKKREVDENRKLSEEQLFLLLQSSTKPTVCARTAAARPMNTWISNICALPRLKALVTVKPSCCLEKCVVLVKLYDRLLNVLRFVILLTIYEFMLLCFAAVDLNLIYISYVGL